MPKLASKPKGAAANYITRTRAVRKLQISLAEFRRLCILKGIYPRAPKNKKKASGNNNNNNTFFLVKDIQFLMHEPLLQKIRDERVFLRKLRRAITKGQESTAKLIEENKPTYTLDHLIKERYPSFIDAVRDLDDCLCHIFLFASLPASDKIPAAVIEDARKLGAEFMNYVIYSHSLKKTFLSIKGIYYQVEVKGQEVTWLQPYEFATPIPHDVDLKVMLTFLEFYRCLLGFVNFKLYSEHGLKYPPILKKELEEEGAGSITSFSLVTSTGEVLGEQPKAKVSNSEKKRAELLKKVAQKQMKSLDRKLEEIKESDSTPVPAEIQDEIVLENEEKTNAPAFLFSKHKVFLSREVPRYSLEFVLKTFGATVGWHETSGAGSPYIEDDSSITLEIVDRPVDSIKTIAGRIYVQPQWVYDSINAGALVNEAEYAPGQKLPPHLSPFKPYEALDEVELSDEEEVVIEGESDVEVDIDEDEVITEEPLNEGQVQKQKRIEEDEKVEMAKMMLSNKKRKYVERIQERKKEEQEQKKQLLRKRKQLKA